jgi:CRP-like cAMP-binding protein
VNPFNEKAIRTPPASGAQVHGRLLMQGKWFKQIAPLLQQQLLDAAVVRKLADGERLFSRGDACCGLYAVLDGRVQVSGVGGAADNAKEAVLTFIEPPDWFGEIAIFDGQTRTHDAAADGDAVVLQVAQSAMVRLLEEHPIYWRELALLMSHKLRLLFALVEETAMLPAPVRLVRRLLWMAEGYGGRHDEAQRKRVLHVSQEQLSRLLAISRQTSNQILKNLEQQGLIRLNRNAIELIDFEGLRQVVVLGRTDC